MTRERERGEIKISTVLTLAFLAFIVYQVVQWGGPAFAIYSFLDTVKEECRFGLNKDEKVIRQALVAEARELGLPIGAENISIQKQGTTTRIVVKYDVDVEWFPGQTYTWQVDVNEYSKFF